MYKSDSFGISINPAYHANSRYSNCTIPWSLLRAHQRLLPGNRSLSWRILDLWNVFWQLLNTNGFHKFVNTLQLPWWPEMLNPAILFHLLKWCTHAMAALCRQSPDFFLLCFPHNIRHYVLHLGRLDLKVITPDGLITLGWRTSDVSFVFLLVIIFVVIVFDGTAHVAGDDDTHQL